MRIRSAIGVFISLLISIFIFGFDAEAQIFSGRGIFNENANTQLDNACRVRINDLRISIQDLTNDINEIRNCSARGGVPMRSAGSIICRDIVLGHHEMQNGGTEIRFASDKGSSGWGNIGKMVGKQGADGQNVRCDCTATWLNPSCPPDKSGTLFLLQTACSTGNPSECETCQGPAQTVAVGCTCSLPGTWEDPVCPPGAEGEHTAAQTCSSFGQCCGTGESVTVQCGTPCNEWDTENAWCPALGKSLVVASCPSGNCCGADPSDPPCPAGDFELRGCNTPAEPNTGGWGACGGTCKTQCIPSCYNKTTNDKVNCSHCGGCSVQSAACEGGSCTPQCTYSWVIANESQNGGWGNCSVSCGTGTQTRTVSCQCGAETVSDSLCHANVTAPKPDTTQACNTQSCPCENCVWCCETGGEVGNSCKWGAYGCSTISCSTAGASHPNRNFGGTLGPELGNCPGVCDPIGAWCQPRN